MPEANHEHLNRLPLDDARRALARCCGAERWVEGMLARLPLGSEAELFAAAEEVWSTLDADDYLAAFAHHPEIGADLDELRRKFASTAAFSADEQRGVTQASEATLLALRAGNLAYKRRFGFLFIVCASGKSADELLALLRERLEHPPEAELRIAAAEQAKITRLRLARLAT